MLCCWHLHRPRLRLLPEQQGPCQRQPERMQRPRPKHSRSRWSHCWHLRPWNHLHLLQPRPKLPKRNPLSPRCWLLPQRWHRPLPRYQRWSNPSCRRSRRRWLPAVPRRSDPMPRLLRSLKRPLRWRRILRLLRRSRSLLPMLRCWHRCQLLPERLPRLPGCRRHQRSPRQKLRPRHSRSHLLHQLHPRWDQHQPMDRRRRLPLRSPMRWLTNLPSMPPTQLPPGRRSLRRRIPHSCYRCCRRSLRPRTRLSTTRSRLSSRRLKRWLMRLPSPQPQLQLVHPRRRRPKRLTWRRRWPRPAKLPGQLRCRRHRRLPMRQPKPLRLRSHHRHRAPPEHPQSHGPRTRPD